MPQVHDIGNKYYAHTMQYPTKDFPLIEEGTTHEIEEPYRYGRCLVTRLPWTRTALVVGKWVSVQDERSNLEEAIGYRRIDVPEA
jgi:hypothetical protein